MDNKYIGDYSLKELSQMYDDAMEEFLYIDEHFNDFMIYCADGGDPDEYYDERMNDLKWFKDM